MKKIVFLFLLCCSTVAVSVAQEQTTLTRFEGQPITGIDASGAWQIEFVQGNATKAELTFPKRLEKQLEFTLHEGQLRLGFYGNVRAKSDDKFVARVICSSLTEVELSGACSLKGIGKFTGDKVEFDLTGAAKVEFTGELTVSREVKIDNSGATKLSAVINTPDLDIELSGASVITLSGESGSGKVDISGAAKANLEDMNIRTLTLDASGAAKLNLNVSELVTGEASGAVKVNIKGNAQKKVSVSGAASIH